MSNQEKSDFILPSAFLDKAPLPELSEIASRTGEYAAFNKVWVHGGECYLLTDEEYEAFLRLEVPVINHKHATLHTRRTQ